MISLVVFSVVIGMSSSMVKKGMEYPFIIYDSETWVSFMEEVNMVILVLPRNTDLESIRTDTLPLNRIQQPPDLINWQVNWRDSEMNQMKAAVFSAESRQGKTFEWRIFKITDD